MWDKLFAWLRVAWDSGAETKRNSQVIRDVLAQNEQFALLIQALFAQQAHERELREKEVTRLERELEAAKQLTEYRLREAEKHAALEAENRELKLRLEISQQQMKQLPPPDNSNQ